MVIFTDGEDTTSIVHGRSLDDILKSAVDNHMPLYFVRTNYDKGFGEIIPDASGRPRWRRPAAGIYAAKDEASLLARSTTSIAWRSARFESGSTRASSRGSRCLRCWRRRSGSAPPGLKLGTPWFSRIP